MIRQTFLVTTVVFILAACNPSQSLVVPATKVARPPATVIAIRALPLDCNAPKKEPRTGTQILAEDWAIPSDNTVIKLDNGVMVEFQFTGLVVLRSYRFPDGEQKYLFDKINEGTAIAMVIGAVYEGEESYYGTIFLFACHGRLYLIKKPGLLPTASRWT